MMNLWQKRAAAVVCLLVGWMPMVAMAQPQDGQGPPPALVRVGQAQVELVQNRSPVIGQLEQIRHAVVASEQAGRVVAMNVEEGDPVVGGQTVLAVIDDVWARTDLDAANAAFAQAQAAVAESQARLDNARREREYLEELERRASARPKEVEDARAAERMAEATLQNAQAQVVQAQASITRARELLERTRIIAPFDGVVVRKSTEVGQWVQQGSPVAEVISRGQIDAVIDVPERQINLLSVGSEVELQVAAMGEPVQGQVVAINPMGAITARTFPVKIRLDDRDGLLKPAMSVTAHVPLGEQVQVVTVPRDAVRRVGHSATVWMNGDGRAVPVGVQVLFGLGDRYAVRPMGGALPAGAQVVIEGAERLFPGQPLSVVGEATASRAS